MGIFVDKILAWGSECDENRDVFIAAELFGEDTTNIFSTYPLQLGLGEDIKTKFWVH